MVFKMYLCNFKLSFSQQSRSICPILIESIRNKWHIILSLCQWFKMGCHLNIFLRLAILFGGAEPFVHFGRGDYGEHLLENICVSGSDVRKFTANRQWMTDKVR